MTIEFSAADSEKQHLVNSKFELEQDINEIVSVLSCLSTSNFEFTRYYFSESVLFYVSTL